MASAALVILAPSLVRADDDAAAARRDALRKSYGTYSGAIRKPDGRLELTRLIRELGEIGANNYNFLIGRADADWDDLHTLLPLAREHGIRVWATIMPPSESPPRARRYSEPFRLDFEKWASEFAALSKREPALVAWSIDDFAHNLKTFTPDLMTRVIAAQRKANPNFAFAPCVYFRQATPKFATTYGPFCDGLLFPYRSDSTTSGFDDATQVASEVRALKQRFGQDFPIVVDVYATRHSQLGLSTATYVEQVMNLAYPVADGVHIYCHQDQHKPAEVEKYNLVKRIMSSWAQATASNDK
jgi:hypothetical protein